MNLTVGAQPGRGLNLPRRQPRYGFSMTAMADMLFQLLIFFMLSTNLTPFAMLDIRTGTLAQGGGAEGAPRAGGVLSDAGATAVWTLNPDGLVASGQQFGLDDLAELARALTDQGTLAVLLVLRPDVPVQNVVAVLEVLAASGIASVQIADGGGA